MAVEQGTSNGGNDNRSDVERFIDSGDLFPDTFDEQAGIAGKLFEQYEAIVDTKSLAPDQIRRVDDLVRYFDGAWGKMMKQEASAAPVIQRGMDIFRSHFERTFGKPYEEIPMTEIHKHFRVKDPYDPELRAMSHLMSYHQRIRGT